MDPIEKVARGYLRCKTIKGRYFNWYKVFNKLVIPGGVTTDQFRKFLTLIAEK